MLSVKRSLLRIAGTDAQMRGSSVCHLKTPFLERPLFRGDVRKGSTFASQITHSHMATSQFQNWLDPTHESFKKLSIEERAIPCLVANEPLKEGEKIVTLTQDKWISLETVLLSRIGSAVKDLDPWLQLALFLLSEKSDAQSEWKPFIDGLPTELASPAFWSDDELVAIEGTQLHETALGYR